MPTTVLTPDDFTDGKIGLLTTMVKCGLASSNREARQSVQQGGVTLNGEKVTDVTYALTPELVGEELVIRKGKKNYHKVVFQG